jgi:hypothetical protein
VGFDISGVEPLDFAIRELVRQQNTNQIFWFSGYPSVVI